MTEHTDIEKIKDSLLYREASQNVDSRMIEIVRLLARRAAKDDQAEMQKNTNNQTLH